MPKLKAARPPAASSDAKYLSDRDIAKRYRVDRSTPWRWAAAGKFPKPVQLSPGCTRWVAAEVDAHDATRAAARNHQAA